jgi:hypothetical protein
MTKIGTNVSNAAVAPVINNPASQQKGPGGIGYVRSLLRNYRRNLALGETVVFIDTKDEPIKTFGKKVELPLALFKAVSTKPELVVGGKVVIPETIEHQAVAYVVSKISGVSTAHGVQQLSGIVVNNEHGQVVQGNDDVY